MSSEPLCIACGGPFGYARYWIDSRGPFCSPACRGDVLPALSGVPDPGALLGEVREVLEFYADPKSYEPAPIADTGDSEEPVMSEGGHSARALLQRLPAPGRDGQEPKETKA